MKNSPLFGALAIALTLGACKKDDEKPKSKTELLTAKNWRITEDKRTTATSTQSTTTDAYASYQECMKDDFVKYNTNKQVEFNKGTTKCSATEAQSQTNNWDFTADETKLILSASSGFSVTYDIVELNASAMKLKVTNTSQGTTSTQEVTFAAF
ncbi:hypothetical protein [Hymenobacter latericus]|uniref:hypothetical protein n=1 Tax=Hymenobacter sp. YIM 151858-1 TaxID=2987688 RepID=UPI002227B205|nr:hypothetical protein [Hymenobacter sp. YIM 151858-1]UYZ58598.1 hypothetical protein OIS50_16240 [Hymenobacter sp. YIM 151858-1]